MNHNCNYCGADLPKSKADIEREAVRRMGVQGPSTMYWEDECVWNGDHAEPNKQQARKRCNITADFFRDIDAGKEVWFRNNLNGRVARAVKVGRSASHADWEAYRNGTTKNLESTGEPHGIHDDSGIAGYISHHDFQYLEVIQMGDHITSAAMRGFGLGCGPVAISGHGLQQMVKREITQSDVVRACIHGEVIQEEGTDHRLMKEHTFNYQRNHDWNKVAAKYHRELHETEYKLRVVIKKNYKAHCCEVITAYWRGTNPSDPFPFLIGDKK